MSDEEDMEMTLQWEKCQSRFIRSSHGVGSIVLPMCGKYNCDNKSGFFYLTTFQGVLLEDSRPHVFLFICNFNHFYVEDASPKGTSYLAPLPDMW